MCGIYLNRQLYLITLVSIPLTLPLFFSESIFLAMGQGEERSAKASIYVIYMIPGLIAYAYSTAY
jgi:MATE family multidrug resistance protein